MNTKIKINQNTIEIISNITGETIFTIWREDFDIFRNAMKRCDEYNKKQKELDNEYE